MISQSPRVHTNTNTNEEAGSLQDAMPTTLGVMSWMRWQCVGPITGTPYTQGPCRLGDHCRTGLTPRPILGPTEVVARELCNQRTNSKMER